MRYESHIIDLGFTRVCNGRNLFRKGQYYLEQEPYSSDITVYYEDLMMSLDIKDIKNYKDISGKSDNPIVTVISRYTDSHVIRCEDDVYNSIPNVSYVNTPSFIWDDILVRMNEDTVKWIDETGNYEGLIKDFVEYAYTKFTNKKRL